MAKDSATSNVPKKDTDKSAAADSDSEAEDVFHDARFPADEEAVSYVAPLTTALSSSFTEKLTPGTMTATSKRVSVDKS